MSRRKQTKPFKVEEKSDIKRDKKPKLRRILPRLTEESSSQRAPASGGNLSDAEISSNAYARRGKNSTKCDKCGKVLASALSLARHKLTHSENKPYQCTECGAGFKTSSNMHRHLRIHFRESKEQSDSEIVLSKPRACTQRPPRQNIRTPNKFREFDVDLVGMNPRGASDAATTNARSYSKAKDAATPKKQASPRLSPENTEDVKENSTSDIDVQESDDAIEDLPDLNMPRRLSRTDGSRPEDLVCHICHKTFISKFGLLTHTLSHSEEDAETRCNICDQNFTTPKGLIVHNVVVHKIAEQKGEAVKKMRSFKDIAIIDFSVKKFPVIAEAACTISHCAPPLRDTQHIFICKKCDKAFPLLESLDLHVAKNHQVKLRTQPTTGKKKIDDFLANFNLCSVKDGNEAHGKENARMSSVKNGTDDDNILTSKLVAVKRIPLWLQTKPEMEFSTYQKESEIPVSLFRRVHHYDAKEHAKYFNSTDITRNSDPKLSLYVPHNKRRTRNQVDSATLLRSFDPGLRQVDSDKLSSDKNVFWCRICNYSSHEKSALVRHLLTHSGIRPYFCKICDYAFTTKANCERHVRKRHHCHERAELDAAVRCDWELLKKAPREDIYMISASNSMCPVCNKSFPSNNDLKMHMKCHEERHFVCQLCNVRCTTRNNCVRHILHKHPGIPHQQANTIITFVGKTDFELDKLPDIIKDKPEIDISKGRLGGKKRNKGLSWSRPVVDYKRIHSDLHHPPSKKPRLPSETVTGSHNAIDDHESNIPMSFPGSDGENHDDTTPKPIKILPLIPLLKIKAYNEAAMRSYSDLVALYQHFNFLNTAENDPMTLDDTIMPMVASPKEENFSRGETTFICRSCEKSFDTEDELNSHIMSCEGAEESDAIENQVGDNEMLSIFGANENGLSEHSENIFASDGRNSLAKSEEDSVDGSVGDVMNWNVQAAGADTEAEMNNPLSVQVFEGDKSGPESWPNNSISNSPFSVKSPSEATGEEFDSPFSKDRAHAASYSKEISYVEDSLLMSMFANEPKNEINDENNDGIRDSPTALSLPRYSSSFPTMVDMPSSRMGMTKYKSVGQYSQLDDEKSSLLGKGKSFTTRKCPQCNKTFPWASSLRRHIMTHTGLKLYMCRLCKMRFTTRSNLIRHVYRRHGMAKQHPDFASCLAKLHPSDTLLREVEADVRRRIDGKRKRIPGTRNAYESVNHTESKDDADTSGRRRKKGKTSDFQSMLEEDPETMLVDLDYSPRDEVGLDGKKLPSEEGMEQGEDSSTMSENRQSTTEIHEEPEEDDDINSEGEADSDVNETSQEQDIAEDQPSEPEPEQSPRWKIRRRRTASITKTTTNEAVEKTTPPKITELAKAKEIKQERVAVPLLNHKMGRSRSKQYSNFVCGLCKKIFKNVEELRTHLETHNVPHSWHCPVCGVPFTNKYNCQRHISRRHGLHSDDVKPLYVEDIKHGPRTARGHPRKSGADVSTMDYKMS